MGVVFVVAEVEAQRLVFPRRGDAEGFAVPGEDVVGGIALSFPAVLRGDVQGPPVAVVEIGAGVAALNAAVVRVGLEAPESCEPDRAGVGGEEVEFPVMRIVGERERVAGPAGRGVVLAGRSVGGAK